MPRGAHRALARLEVQLAIDRLRVRQSSLALSASARHTLTDPMLLVVPYAAGALATALVVRPRVSAARSARRMAPVTRAVRLARAAMRAWSRTAAARELLKPIVHSLITGRSGAPPTGALPPGAPSTVATHESGQAEGERQTGSAAHRQ